MRRTILHNFILSVVSLQFVLMAGQFSLVPIAQAQDSVALDEGETIDPYLVISAVQITGGTGHTQEDFIELYNPTDEPFDLNGHRLVKRTATAATDSLVKAWTESSVVEAHHFYLWANSSFSSLPVAADSISTATLADNNGIALRQGANDAGVIVDDISWGNTANGFTSVSDTNPAGNQSLTRSNLFEEPAIFEIAPSNPRNSAAVLDPPQPPNDPPVDDPPVDDPPIDEDPPDDPPIEDDPPGNEEPPVELSITELYPNPSGSDSGFEQVEIYNSGSETVDLIDFKLDDVGPRDALTSNVYVLPELSVEPNSYLAITIPSGKFALNNTGGDELTLFNTAGEPVGVAKYSDNTPEGKSYSLFDNDNWFWAEPTLGEGNGTPPLVEEDEDNEEDEEDQTPHYDHYDNSGLRISEISSTPEAGTNEFIELYNDGEENAQLGVVTLWIGERHKLMPEYELKPGAYYVIDQGSLPVQLRNSGQVIKLLEDSDVLDSVTYPALTAGSSYARFEDGFQLTTRVTKNAGNILQLPEIVKKEATVAAAKTASPKTTAKKATAKASTKKSAAAQAKVAAKSPAVAGLSTQNTNSNSNTESTDKPAQNNKDSMGKIIAMGAAAAAAGVIALYKLVFNAGIE